MSYSTPSQATSTRSTPGTHSLARAYGRGREADRQTRTETEGDLRYRKLVVASLACLCIACLCIACLCIACLCIASFFLSGSREGKQAAAANPAHDGTTRSLPSAALSLRPCYCCH
jgi:hypothetical protein